MTAPAVPQEPSGPAAAISSETAGSDVTGNASSSRQQETAGPGPSSAGTPSVDDSALLRVRVQPGFHVCV